MLRKAQNRLIESMSHHAIGHDTSEIAEAMIRGLLIELRVRIITINSRAVFKSTS